jgi:small subunit ribosomal protein S21
MAIRIKARSGESVEQMLRRFKKLCEKEGLTKDVKRRAHYEKPSERKRRDARRHEPRPVRVGSDRQGGSAARGPKRESKGPRGPRGGGGF